ncbi:murein hydrolase activator EnvC family protein [Kaistia algarum]|uniref:murein hydrolase activator EnvC family protein n=1 Tax=Kaistia algarum TaxID=2083279 RepID=UPI002253722B|nr:murein hydrolase activator EnvC [Kaistia algarum]MCX5514094.1 murein hydrolase activator EnvC [Kaistia algarum]
MAVDLWGRACDRPDTSFGPSNVHRLQHSAPSLRAAAFAALLLALLSPEAHAADEGVTPASTAPTAAEQSARRAELDAITRDIDVTKERQEALRSEIAKLDNDSTSLTSALVDTGERATELEKKIDKAEQRMSSLLDEEKTVHDSLAARRGTLANVLAALQRMGRKPPPAIVVRPQDALSAVRSAMLLGAVVPELRGEAIQLAGDLQHLLALKGEQERERDRMRADSTALAEERTRIQLLVEEKKKARVASEQQLADEQSRSEQLARKATSLKDLIASLEKQVAASADAAAAASKAEADNQAALESGKASPNPDSLGARNRIAPAVAFGNTKGMLPMPVNGVQMKGFGDADGLGGTTQGISIATRAGNGVSSPADGWVVYAGPFRSYGQLLIINAGGGYHILLAGMERIDVELGQFVLAGEPVAVMGSRLLASNNVDGIGATQPMLYVEFRKDGTSIDPAPWWARSNDEKVGG